MKFKNRKFPLYDPKIFHDACGTGFIVSKSGQPDKRILSLALKSLKKLSHRGAASSDNKSGDGSGIMTDLPVKFFKLILKNIFNIKLSSKNKIAVGMVFTTSYEKKWIESIFRKEVKRFGMNFLVSRDVPVNEKVLGKSAYNTKPTIVQFIISSEISKAKLEHNLFLLRKIIQKHIFTLKKKSYVCSLSSKTIIYKGLLTSDILDHFYIDLSKDSYVVKFALFHERFSTNTNSTWSMAQPFNFIAHNGEFNTIKGNRLWMKTRETDIALKYWSKHKEYITPIINYEGSDSQSFNSALEFLVRSGRNIYDSIMIMVPDSYTKNQTMKKRLRDYFIYNENLMEPWDGPAAVVFTDGDVIGAKMDRNGLRPLRYSITKDDLVIVASEAGILEIPEDKLVLHHHMKSEEIFGIDLNSGKIFTNDLIKKNISEQQEYGKILNENLHYIERKDYVSEFRNHKNFYNYEDIKTKISRGLTQEDINKFIIPMATNSREAIGSMGDDTPISMLSIKERSFYDYFKQWFAQVTNPPIDPIRERDVMSLHKYLGSEDDFVQKGTRFNDAIRISSPILSPKEIDELFSYGNWFKNKNISCHYKKNTSLESRLNHIKSKSKEAVDNGAKLIFLSDEFISQDKLPIPMALVTSLVHHYLVDKQVRNKVSIICLAGDVIEDHDVAVLLSLGASAVYPHIAYDTIKDVFIKDDWMEKMSNYRYALEKGLLKIMSKMGISTISSYSGSMLMHSIGLGEKFSKKYFPSIPSLFGGIEIDHLNNIIIGRNNKAYGKGKDKISDVGLFRFLKSGEAHGYSPKVFQMIQKNKTINLSNNKDIQNIVYIRELFDFKSLREPLKIDKIEKTKNILKRFGSGGVSFGAISEQSHRDLAKGFSLVGARSNTGEGGELEDRYSLSNPDKTVNSFVKQIASGRFGVTIDYLSAAGELQIKMAQGAKPGEGGQLPGYKVTNLIASARSSTPGMPLISPPPHHDIYSIEDIKQLIYDLKEANSRAKVSVKLVAQPGIGTVASGVVKAGADIILISGYDGGTGASPLGSLKHAGFPWEYGLAETHQVLTANNLRDQVTLRVDGGLKWSKDILVAAMLGAEEFDFGTSALVALGCVMARKCHLNNCPKGIATQDEKYLIKYKGSPENLSKYLENIAKDIQMDLASLGYKEIQSVIGRSDLLQINKDFKNYIKNQNINLNNILNPNAKNGLPLKSELKVRFSKQRRASSIDEEIFTEIRSEILTHGHGVVYKNINNTNRSIGTRLSGEIAFLFGKQNFKGSIQCRLFGTAGQSFGAYLGNNIELRLKGVANDYVGKGMSSGLITIRMPDKIRKQNKDHTVIGNVALYGATGGNVYIAGQAGERFGVRNSGACGVIEGIGNHGCEYMTQGTIIILGNIGKNFGAGMTGGVSYIYSKNKSLKNQLNYNFVYEDELKLKDKNLILRFLRNHVFHTDSSLGKKVINNWNFEKDNFKKIKPKAMDIINLDEIYSLQTSDRINVLLNE